VPAAALFTVQVRSVVRFFRPREGGRRKNWDRGLPGIESVRDIIGHRRRTADAMPRPHWRSTRQGGAAARVAYPTRLASPVPRAPMTHLLIRLPHDSFVHADLAAALHPGLHASCRATVRAEPPNKRGASPPVH
jgi:hypothetical protein